MADLLQDYLGMALSAPELRALVPDWPEAVINDYTSLTRTLRMLRPASGDGDPEGVVAANLSGFYVNTGATPATLWFNPSPSSRDGWRQIGV